jgi:hypothetical protein
MFRPTSARQRFSHIRQHTTDVVAPPRHFLPASPGEMTLFAGPLLRGEEGGEALRCAFPRPPGPRWRSRSCLAPISAAAGTRDVDVEPGQPTNLATQSAI